MFYDQSVSSNPAAKLLKEALVWLQPSGIEDTAGNVTAWRNSGTGGDSYSVLSGTGTVTVGLWDSKAVANFIPGATLSTSSGINIGSDFTWCVFARCSVLGTSTATRFVRYRTGGVSYMGVINSSQSLTQFHSTVANSAPGTWSDKPVYIIGTGNGATLKTWFSETSPLTRSITPDILNWGTLSDAVSTVSMTGWIGEVIVWPFPFSDSDASKIDQYLRSEWTFAP